MIEETLNSHSLKQNVLAEMMNVRPSTLSEIKKEKRPLPAFLALKMAHQFDIALPSLKSGKCDSTFPNKNFFPFPEEHSFWENLDELFDFDTSRLFSFFKSLGLNCQAMALQRGKYDSPRLKDLLIIASELDCSPFYLYSKQLNTDVIKKNRMREFGRPSHIPDHLTLAAGSKMRTFKHAVTYSRNIFGEFIIDQILESMQIPTIALTHSDKNISILSFSLFHEKLKLFGADEKFFIRMGAANTKNEKNKRHFRQLLSPSSPKEAYQGIFDKLANAIDKNFTYEKILMDDHICIIKTGPRAERRKEVPKEALLSKEVMLYRFGHFLYTPQYFDLPTGDLESSSYEWYPETGEAFFYMKF